MTPPNASDAFLSGQGIPVAPGEIEAELARLWGPSAERVGGPDLENPNVTRVSLANLVVVDLGPGEARVVSALDTIVARRPCRAIVLRDGEGPERRVMAEVSALCHLPAPGLPQVCSERIVLGAGPNALDLLPGAVFALLEPDLPLILWWVGDPRPASGLFRTLAAESARLIADLPDPAPDLGALRALLDCSACPHGRDLSWFGISAWRELVAQFFDPPGAAETLRRLGSVEVVAATPPGGGVPRVAAWLAAWLAGQLGWSPVRRSAPGADRVEATFAGPSGEISVTLRAEADPDIPLAQIRRVALSGGPDGEERLGLERPDGGSGEVRIETCSACRCALPRLVHAPEFDEARRVAAALESSRDDPPYRNALPHLLWLLGG